MSNSKRKFVIEADQMPSKTYSVTLLEPTFRDRRDASKRMPANPEARIGYSIEQLLLAMCIEGINGHVLRMDPSDPISKIKQMPPDDLQFLIAVFLEAFTLNEELAEDARALSESLKDGIRKNYTIPKEKMPNESFSITFAAPTTGMQIEVERRYPGADSGCGYSSEEMLFASCITHLDGVPVEESKPKDTITFIDDWTHIDVQYAMGVFINLCYINREQRMSAKNLGKLLRTNDKPTSTTTLTPSDTSTTA